MSERIIIFIVVILAFGWWINSIHNLYQKEDKMKAKIGTSFVLQKDTLLIIDCSIWDNNFTLSNGKKVNSKLILNSK